MLIWDDSITLAKWLAVDSGTETDTMAKMIMNLGYKQILARFRRNMTSDTMTTSTVATQRSYMLPPTFLRPVSVSFTYGGNTTPVEHVQNEDIWNQFIQTGQSSSRPLRYFTRYRFGVSGAEILLDPIPSAVGTLQVVFEAGDRDLNVAKYTTGDIALTANSTDVVGSGTTFTNAMVGRYLNTTDADGDGYWYRIGSYTSATSITLETSYSGADYSGNYQIAEAFALPEEMQILPVYYFLQHYYSRKQKEKKVAEYAGLYAGLMKQAQQDYNSKDDNAKIFNVSKYSSGWPQATPSNFPQSVSE